MIDLYHCVSARSFRPLWMLEELNTPYQLHMLPFPPRVHAREFMQINPLGTVPLLIDGATKMTESAAMCEYLARRYSPGQLEMVSSEADWGAYLNWLHMSDATLTFPQTLVLRYRHFEAAERRQPQVADDYERWFLARLRALHTRVADHEFLCADRFTAADVAVSYALFLGQQLGIEAKYPQPVQEYWQRMQERPAFQNALAAQNKAALLQGIDPTPPADLRFD